VVVLGFAERPRFLPHGVSRVDIAESGNGVVEKMGGTSKPLNGPDVISPSMSYDCEATHQCTRVESEARH
jgi:hypothetical protein